MKHRRRFLLSLVLLVGLAVVGVGVVAWVVPKDRINDQSYVAIKPEMTEELVEALLGVPPGDYRTAEARGGGNARLEWWAKVNLPPNNGRGRATHGGGTRAPSLSCLTSMAG
jgi:hypothetical protein